MRKLILIILPIALTQISYAGIIKHNGEGDDIASCISDTRYTPVRNAPESIERLECYSLKSLNGINKLTNLKSLTLGKTQKQYKEGSKLVFDPKHISNSVSTLKLRAIRVVKSKGWDKSEIIALAKSFPKVTHIICRICNYNDFGDFSLFPELAHISIEMLPVIELSWRHGWSPDKEINFDGLLYDRISNIYIANAPSTNISCRNLGMWSYKINSHFSGRSSFAKPFKDMNACFPNKQNITGLILLGDEHYKKGNMNEAYKNYHEAFFINPYDQKAISSLSLMYYKKNEYCKSAQIAASGTKLVNGTPSTRASILYNLYIALIKLKDFKGAKEALVKSNTLKPTSGKQEKLNKIYTTSSQTTTCQLKADWIQEIYNNLETEAVLRSRPRGY